MEEFGELRYHDVPHPLRICPRVEEASTPGASNFTDKIPVLLPFAVSIDRDIAPSEHPYSRGRIVIRLLRQNHHSHHAQHKCFVRVVVGEFQRVDFLSIITATSEPAWMF